MKNTLSNSERKALKAAARKALSRGNCSRATHLAAMFIIGVPYKACEPKARIDLSAPPNQEGRFKHQERFALDIAKEYEKMYAEACEQYGWVSINTPLAELQDKVVTGVYPQITTWLRGISPKNVTQEDLRKLGSLERLRVAAQKRLSEKRYEHLFTPNPFEYGIGQIVQVVSVADAWDQTVMVLNNSLRTVAPLVGGDLGRYTYKRLWLPRHTLKSNELSILESSWATISDGTGEAHEDLTTPGQVYLTLLF